jgi:heptosyltransferase-2
MDAPPMEDPQSILIIDTAWLGDAVLTTSLVGSVKTHWPAAKLHVLVSPRGQAVLSGHPMIDNLWVFDKRGKDRGLFGLLRLASGLRQVGFNLILNAHPSFRSRILTCLTGAPERVGYSGFGANWCFTKHIAYDPAAEPDHIGRRNALLQLVTGPWPAEPPFVPVLPESAAWSADFLHRHQAMGKPLLGLIPGTAWETKRWPLESYSELAAHWIQERDGAVLVFGGTAERDMVTGLCQFNLQRIIPVIQEPLPNVAALLHACTSVVGGDTGVMFLAAAVQKPQVLALHGCTQRNHPFIPPSRAITAGVPCCIDRAGHGAHRCKWQEGYSWCMSQIPVERVWNALEENAEMLKI